MSDATVSLSILAAVVVLFVWNRFPVELVAVGAALALFFSGVLTLDESLAGFGDPAVILIAALFVVSEGLDATGVTTWLGRMLVEKSGGSSRRLLVFTMASNEIVTEVRFWNLNNSTTAVSRTIKAR